MKYRACLAFLAPVVALGLGAYEGVPRAIHLALAAGAVFCAAGTVFGIVYTLVAGVLTRRFFARSTAEPTHCPPVTVVKPLHGDERALLDNLTSFCAQDYPGAVQFVFGVHDAADPALDTVARLRLRCPQAHITVVADARVYGPNRKISNIVNMLPHAQHDVLVFADSDVSVAPDYLRRIVGELEKPDVGLVTCLYRGAPDPGFWPRLSAKGSDYQFLPGVVMGLALGLARPCFGQTIAMRRETLDRIGGLGQFVHHLAEDHAIGQAVRMTGQRVAYPPFAVDHACVETTAAKLIAHELRWSRTIRTIDPLGHLGSALTHPLAFALLGVIFSGDANWSCALAVTALMARLVLKLQLDSALRQPRWHFGLLPVWDLVFFALFVASFYSTRVMWRGFSFTVGRDGLLHPLKEDT